MTAWVVVSASAAITASASPSVTFTGYIPQANDVVVMFPSSTGTAITPTAPTGWTNPLGGTTDVESDSHETSCVYYVVTSTDATNGTKTYTATSLYGATTTGDVVACVVRGADTTNLIDSVNSTFDSGNTVTPHVLASLTGANLSTDSLVLASVAKDGTGAYSSAPSGWQFVATSNTNQGVALLKADATTTSGTDIAATNITPSAGDEYASITLAITSAATSASGITYLSGSTVSAGTTAASYAIPVPQGARSGEIVAVGLLISQAITVTPPAGFTEATGSPAQGTDGYAGRVFTKRLTGSDVGTYTFSYSGSTYSIGLAGRYGYCIPSGGVVDVATASGSGQGASTAPVGLSITTTGNNELLLWICASNTITDGQIGNPSGFNNRNGFNNGTNDGALQWSDKLQAPAGSSGSITTSVNSSNNYHPWLGALKPAANMGQFFAMF